MFTKVPFQQDETHGIVTRAGNRHRVSSDGQHWHALYASAQTEVPFEGHFSAVKDQLLVLHRTGPVTLDRYDTGRPKAHLVPRGGIHMYPGGIPFSVRLHGVLDTMHVYLRRSVIEEIAADLVAGDPALVEIPINITDRDRTLENLMEAVLFALEDKDSATTIYIDHLARALAAHLVRHYSGATLRAVGTGATRSDVMCAVEYMRANIDQPIGLADLAETVGKSPSYLSRRFREQFGKAPHAYLIEMRLDLARELLERTTDRIAVIALDCGFSHQEHLTRLFRRKFNTTPAAWRRSKYR
ncbi:helix-turn-helix domain-containing protein [Pelagibacterium halotolerans]|uniref:Transcriptional regulator, AraC family protein n=1 Tax=Pelagibacterium halotolerans (strain DSM 22347 / JCM 15775 / CGMCC 1.7692 / B2) TaxID=1082931 RepID=G4RGY9_PELHB|nr:AraC family transcriptional regulator [Pelagibacterium halotolerans]AEQ53142.1 transcriptional regulator, AraC family protein [Pelagibacterium halotolerans B2]QJR17220.1 helix-turn-helix transcriptional regulator [Pelagibacterium halotolerans]SEA88790.1 transcriptional regulator, AraC family [Pelagibacterium halotolerans]